MKYCTKCIQPDTRPSLTFNEQGVCATCQIHDQKSKVDWVERKNEIKAIAQWAKNHSRGFDCVCGASGGKDSTRQALYLRGELGLKVLLVNLSPDEITEVGRLNLENLIQQGFDILSYRCNPIIWKEVTKQSFFKYGNPVKPSEYPLYAVAYQTALAFNIPLVVEGDNPAITLGVTNDMEPNGDAMNINQAQTLAGGKASDWLYDGITLKDLIFYQFPDKNLMKANGIRAIFMNYYVEDWGNYVNTNFAITHGLQGRPHHDPILTGRLNPFCSIDSDLQILNQMLKYYKFGFGFTTDETCHHIREGRMTREQAIKTVELYDGKCDIGYINDFCGYIDITDDEFWATVDKFVNKELFKRVNGKWIPKFKVGEGIVKRS